MRFVGAVMAAAAIATLVGGFAAVDAMQASSSQTLAMSTQGTNGTNHVSTSHFRRRSHEAPH